MNCFDAHQSEAPDETELSVRGRRAHRESLLKADATSHCPSSLPEVAVPQALQLDHSHGDSATGIPRADNGLAYYGYRWYDPVTGRWPSRDPIEERGGINLYGFVVNEPISWIDYLGFQTREYPTTGLDPSAHSTFLQFAQMRYARDEGGYSNCGCWAYGIIEVKLGIMSEWMEFKYVVRFDNQTEKPTFFIPQRPRGGDITGWVLNSNWDDFVGSVGSEIRNNRTTFWDAASLVVGFASGVANGNTSRVAGNMRRGPISTPSIQNPRPQGNLADQWNNVPQTIYSRYPNGQAVLFKVPKVSGPDPQACGAPHTVLRWAPGGRLYGAKEFGNGGIHPTRDMSFTNPTFPNGTPRPNHLPAPTQHPYVPSSTGGSPARGSEEPLSRP